MSSPDPASSPDPPWYRTVARAALSERTATRVVRNGRALPGPGRRRSGSGRGRLRPSPVRAVRRPGLGRDPDLPGHFWRYDLRTGRCLRWAEEVPAFTCRTVDGWVEVQVRDRAPPRSVREMLLAAARRRTSDR